MRRLYPLILLGVGAAVVLVLAALTRGGATPEIGEWDWTAAGTLALAFVTVGVIVQDRLDGKGRERTALQLAARSAVLEQVANCRDWLRDDPHRNHLAAAEMPSPPSPQFVDLRVLCATVDLPADVLGMIVWL